MQVSNVRNIVDKIIFLRKNGFRRDAHLLWEENKNCIPTPSLALKQGVEANYHYSIGMMALEIGDLVLARSVIEQLSLSDFQSFEKLIDLKENFLQYEEVEKLGEPVYPPHVRMINRWNKPLFLDPVNLRVWYPGRVVSIRANSVELVLARVTDKSLLTVKVRYLNLLKMGNGELPTVGSYLEYGDYGNNACVKYHNRLKCRPPKQ